MSIISSGHHRPRALSHKEFLDPGLHSLSFRSLLGHVWIHIKDLQVLWSMLLLYQTISRLTQQQHRVTPCHPSDASSARRHTPKT